jgi:hypothetical protein
MACRITPPAALVSDADDTIHGIHGIRGDPQGSDPGGQTPYESRRKCDERRANVRQETRAGSGGAASISSAPLW